MRVLTLSSLYPNPAQPNHGVFVEHRMRRVATAETCVRVVAPMPWFPSAHPRFGEYAAFAAAPNQDERHGLTVDYLRYLTAPGLGLTLQPYLYYRAALGRVRRLIAEEGPFDLVDAHYFYPDGVAAAWLAERLNLPLTITARGTDVNYIPTISARARRRIVAAAARADRIAAVSEALRQALIDLGVDAGEDGSKIVTLRNGVDLALFKPLSDPDRAAQRALYGADAGTLLCVSVGALIERKGHALTIEAAAALPGARLLIVGEGPERPALQAQIDTLGVGDRVMLLGAVPHAALPALYGAADLSVLASSREGWANVLLESMACGTPVAATAVWGAPEVVADPAAGRLIPQRDAGDIASAIALLAAAPPRRDATRAYAEQFGWEAVANGVRSMFADAVAARRRAGCAS